MDRQSGRSTEEAKNWPEDRPKREGGTEATPDTPSTTELVDWPEGAPGTVWEEAAPADTDGTQGEIEAAPAALTEDATNPAPGVTRGAPLRHRPRHPGRQFTQARPALTQEQFLQVPDLLQRQQMTDLRETAGATDVRPTKLELDEVRV